MRAFGNANLVISVPVRDESETLGLMEANYKYNDQRFVDYRLIGIDCDGSERELTVHDGKLNLDEIVD